MAAVEKEQKKEQAQLFAASLRRTSTAALAPARSKSLVLHAALPLFVASFPRPGHGSFF
jgi:hypothetical protein